MKSRILKYLDLGVEYALYGLVFFIPISIAAINIFTGLAVVLFLIKQILSADFSAIKANKTLFVILLAFFIFMALSLLNSGPLIGKSVKALLEKWGRFPLLLWVILDTFRDARRITNAIYVLSASAVLVGLSALSQKFFGIEFLLHRPLSGGIITGPFKNQNSLAAVLTALIPLVLSLGLWRWSKVFVRVGFWAMTAALLLVSFWTFSRGGWLGLSAGLLLIVLMANHARVKRPLFLFLFWSTYLVVIPLLTLALSYFQGRGDGQRFIIYNGAWKMIMEHPILGKGLGTFMDHCAAYTNNFGTFYAHNCFLQMWAESGIFSLISFLVLMGYVLRRSLRATFNASSKAGASINSFLLIGLTAGLLGSFVHSFFDVHLYSLQLSFLFWVMLGLVTAQCSLFEQKDKGHLPNLS